MADVSGSFYKLIEERLANIEKEIKATEDTVRSINNRAEEHGRRCELASNRLEDLGTGMQTLKETVDCLTEGLIALPNLIGSPSRTGLDRSSNNLSSTLISTYVTEFQSIFNEHVKRAMRKRLDQSFPSQSPGGRSTSDGQCSISEIEEKARDSVRRRLGLSEEDLQSLETFTITSASSGEEDKFEGDKFDPNNNDSVITEKSSTMIGDDQDVMDLLRGLSMEDYESSHSIRVAIATVHAAQSPGPMDDATVNLGAL